MIRKGDILRFHRTHSFHRKGGSMGYFEKNDVVEVTDVRSPGALIIDHDIYVLEPTLLRFAQLVESSRVKSILDKYEDNL